MSISQEQIDKAGAIQPAQPSYIDPNKPNRSVKGTNVPPDFFERKGIDPASVVSAGIKVNVGYKYGKEAIFTLTSAANKANSASAPIRVPQEAVGKWLKTLGAKPLLPACCGC